ncbi:MAG: nucleotidyl transferase AbiEii/AbiGii toxin family protein [Clostridia bacterium]|nr:nucleotidyl transferase AbiEii/AbiGii toxin family protein [Clostridia bacterium]
MAWLHENKEEFRNAVLFAADQNRLAPAVVEKDYYVTLILKGLRERLPFIVFKGGTSLSKCHKVISRFSEDIDVTIDTKLSQGQMGKVKDAIKAVAEVLECNGITRKARSASADSRHCCRWRRLFAFLSPHMGSYRLKSVAVSRWRARLERRASLRKTLLFTHVRVKVRKPFVYQA